ncbi:MAG: hypothetical protein ACE5OY_02925 [Candidatus Bathyarchaeia archaeon]
MVPRLLNLLITLACGTYIAKVYIEGRPRRFFYLAWSLGFLFYGAQVFSKFFFPMISAPSEILTLVSVAFFVIGLGSMLGKTLIFTASYLFIVSLFVLLASLIGLSVVIPWGVLVIFGFPAFGALLVRWKYGPGADNFLIGWILLAVNNTLIPTGYPTVVISDIFATFGKFVIFLGLLNPAFTTMALDMERLLGLSRLSPVKAVEAEGTFALIEPNPGPSRLGEIDWINGQVREGVTEGVKTVLVVLYDLIPESELRARGLLDELNVSLVRMVPGAEEIPVRARAEAEVLTISDDLLALRRVITDIVNHCQRQEIRCHIILYTLSWLTQSHGWREVYQFLTSIVPVLRRSSVDLFGFLYPETHEIKSEVTSLEKLADEIKKL